MTQESFHVSLSGESFIESAVDSRASLLPGEAHLVVIWINEAKHYATEPAEEYYGPDYEAFAEAYRDIQKPRKRYRVGIMQPITADYKKGDLYHPSYGWPEQVYYDATDDGLLYDETAIALTEEMIRNLPDVPSDDYWLESKQRRIVIVIDGSGSLGRFRIEPGISYYEEWAKQNSHPDPGTTTVVTIEIGEEPEMWLQWAKDALLW